jgi:hypothetical protein
MQGHIEQAVELVLRGNAFLRGRPIGSMHAASLTFSICKSVVFVTVAKKLWSTEQVPYAPDPLRWLERLRAEGTLGLRLHHWAGGRPPFSDRMAVGFAGGGGGWLVETVKPAASDGWVGEWTLGDAKDPKRRIWNVAYVRTLADHARLEPKTVGEERLQSEMAEALTAIAGFAERLGEHNFAQCFRGGLEALSAADPFKRMPCRDPLVPQMLPAASQQLLTAAQAAWVFGGMGSWNDLYFEGPEGTDYATLTDRLYGLLNQAVVEAVNASFPA